MRIIAVVLSITLLLACLLLAGCGGGAKIYTIAPVDPVDPGKGDGTGGTGGTGATTTKSGDGTYTGGGTYEANGIKIVGPTIKFPTKFTYLGGDIQFTATVTSTAKIDNVKAVITPPTGTAEDVPMTGTAPYKCTYTVKGNLRMGGPVAQYKIKVVATDTTGKYAETAVGKLDINPPSFLPPDAPF
jgi:hypothetical protein